MHLGAMPLKACTMAAISMNDFKICVFYYHKNKFNMEQTLPRYWGAFCKLTPCANERNNVQDIVTVISRRRKKVHE